MFKKAIFVWSTKTNCNPATLKYLAKRLAVELSFSAAEITDMSFSEIVWWLTD